MAVGQLCSSCYLVGATVICACTSADCQREATDEQTWKNEHAGPLSTLPAVAQTVGITRAAPAACSLIVACSSICGTVLTL